MTEGTGTYNPGDRHRLAKGLLMSENASEALSAYAAMFAFDTLPKEKQLVAQRFSQLAQYLIDNQRDTDELLAAIALLWESRASALDNTPVVLRFSG